MRSFVSGRRLRLLAGAIAITALAGLTALPGARSGLDARAASTTLTCPPGYHPASQEGATSLRGHALRDGLCINDKHPESPEDMAAMGAQQFAVQAAPSGKIPREAYARAIRQRQRVLKLGQSSANRHYWTAYGRGPLHVADKDYPGVNGLGIVDVAGRPTQLVYADKIKTVLASIAYGGVWKSTNEGKSWKSISDKLPTQIVGGVNYTPARGGTVIAITGDGSFGRYSREGAGAYWTNNMGKSWHRSKGVPSDAFGFKVEVDKKNPRNVYVATGGGLFRSTDAGRSFKNVVLPTGPCAGKSNRVKGCLFANTVTDVVVQAPGGAANTKGGAVLAAVGWRYGNVTGPDGKVESPKNGLYFSATGKPKSFQFLDAPGFAPQDHIGRVELGAAYGPDQDHGYVYASVQDSTLAQIGPPSIDAEGNTVGIPTSWRGAYVSSDFGQTWTDLYDASEAQQPSTGSSLAIVVQTIGAYGPGIQSWYDMWIQPDPLLQAGGVPTRVLFGLEEVWENDNINVPQNSHSSFHVIGKYYGGSTCQFLDPQGLGSPTYICPTNREGPFTLTKTTHPDQHAAVFIPHADGSETLVVANDGGTYTQSIAAGGDYDNEHWGDGANQGFHTLYPYDAHIADDGTVWMGLQDNGTAKIQDTTVNGSVQKQRQIEALGGDGFFSGVDKYDSDNAYGEYTYGAMSGTTDGGKTWNQMGPPGLDGSTAQFSTQFAVDPLDFKHVMIAGNQVDETGSGPGSVTDDWSVDYHLGTQKHPGNENATSSEDDPANIMSAIDMYGARAYVGYCGACDVLYPFATQPAATFKSGLATNVGGSKPPKKFTSNGWHIAKARGLPNRYITSIEMDPKDPKTVYVSMGGYRRPHTPPGELDVNKRIGKGHLFVSHNAGKSFRDISANLPNYPVNFLTLRGRRQLLVATDVGVFISGSRGVTCKRSASPKCHAFQVLGKGLPLGQISTVRMNPCDPNQVVIAFFGRGVYTYRFGPAHHCPPLPVPPPPPPFLGQTVAGPFGFEGDSNGWTDQSSASPGWQDQPPGNNSSAAMQITPYQQAATYTLLGPAMTLPDRSSVKVSWAERRDTESCCDFLSLQWSGDGGKTWETAYSQAGQNPDFPLYTNVNTTFVAPAGQLLIRFVLGSDALIVASGVGIDDVKVER